MATHDHEKERKVSSSDSLGGNTEIENASVNNKASLAAPENVDADQLRANINAKIANPLAGFTHAELAQKGEEYARSNAVGKEEDIRAFRLGAILAQNPNRHSEVDGLTPEESAILSKEIEKKWSQPRLLYLVIILCSTCAAVQGMGKFPPAYSQYPTNIHRQTKPLSMVPKSSTANNLTSATRALLETRGFWGSSIRHRIFAAHSSAAGKLLSYESPNSFEY